MRLKRLTLNGYKTFANKTVFEFGEGITCIIGPNGSGKSNIADGIRWALGEQQYSLLRGKKTDDMIFAGSAKRPRASMAEVVLTFDNSDGFFPIAFSEIEIGRRAFRDGSNEYLLNGNRVRLRDVSDLLAHSGLAERNYTVIGQGLVDEALAQKPEERRALFEEAAGITTYRDRREDAMRKLEETRHNLERTKDILSEITPRLKQLERQAERARQYRALADELSQLVRLWLGYQYNRIQRAIEATLLAQHAAQNALTELTAQLSALETQAHALRQSRQALQSQLADALPQRDAARQLVETTTRDLAVMRAKVAGLEEQVATARAEVDALDATMQTLAERAAEAERALAEAQRAHQARQHDLQAAEQHYAERQQERRRLEEQRAQAQRQLRDAAESAQAAKSQLAALRAKQEALRGQLDTLSQRAADLGAQREEMLATLNTLVMAAERESIQVNLFDAQYEAAQRALEQARVELEQAQAALAAAEAEERLSARFTLFADMRALAARGSDELALAAEQAGLPTVRGVLAALIRIAPDDQKAVEAALGDLLNALILAPADAAEGEMGLSHLHAWLVEQTSGRLVVLPMHALRLDGWREADERLLDEYARRQRARPLCEVIQSPDWLTPAIRLLTAYQFIAPNLSVARALAAQLPVGGLCVTRDGEVVYATGALSLPTGARSPIILGAEAALPEITDHEAIKAKLEHARHARERAQRAFELARTELERSARAKESFARESQQRSSRIQDTRQKINLLEDSLAALAGDIEDIESQIALLDREIAETEALLSQHLTTLSEAQQALDAAEASLHSQSQGGWMEALAAAQAALAAALGELRNAESLYRERQAAYAAAQAQRALRAQRLADLQAQQEAAKLSLEQLSAQAAEAELRWRDAEATIAPLTRDIAALEAQLRELEAHQQATERALRERELHLNAATLELARHNEELEMLYRRALEELADEEGLSSSADERRARVLASLPSVESLPEDIEGRIAQLRAQIKRLGPINHEAQAEYEALSERYHFLMAQCEDLEKASAALQQVIAELNNVMKDTFRRTFEAIADAFQVTFKSLFGGGQARLSLVNADNLDACGVEIHAQPPGKRPQSLALLSGGERSLTAVALLFAILQVKPTPLCVLDEVDAALDESNVWRFRTMLESLSDRTQFIVITHNRGTIEAASTIYGISMGADGASTSLSLRLEDVKDCA